MTDINHADLSRQLALALGYAPESVRMNKQIYRKGICEDAENVVVYRSYSAADPRPIWFPFDYRSPDVVVPLIKWLSQPYGAVRIWPSEESWNVRYGDRAREVVNADTLELAVARAVIAVGVR